jgi:hypothetical protein
MRIYEVMRNVGHTRGRLSLRNERRAIAQGMVRGPNRVTTSFTSVRNEADRVEPT